MIYWELYRKSKLEHTDKYYLHQPESVLENETHKILWNFEIQMDHPISSKRPGLVLINKKKRTCHLVDFAIPMNH